MLAAKPPQLRQLDHIGAIRDGEPLERNGCLMPAIRR